MRGLTVDEITYLIERRLAWCAVWRDPGTWGTLSARQQALVAAAEGSLTWYRRIVTRERTRRPATPTRGCAGCSPTCSGAPRTGTPRTGPVDKAVTTLRCRLCPDWAINDLVVDRLFNRVATHFRARHVGLKWREHVERNTQPYAAYVARWEAERRRLGDDEAIRRGVIA